MSTQQTTFGDDDRVNPMNELLSADEKVDQLSEFEVIDVWARGTFMRQIIDGMGPKFMRSEDCEHIEELLSEGTGAAIIQAAITVFGRHHSLVHSLGWEAGEGNARTLFDRLTDTSIDHDDRVEIARREIKSTLGGSCGMARTKIMRQRVNYHTEINAEVN